MEWDRAIIFSLTMIFMLWAGIFFQGNKVQAAELAPVEVTILQKELTVSEGEALIIVPLLEQSVGIHSYQWYKDGVELEGHTEKILEIVSAALQDAGEYKLVVTTTVGSESVQAESETCMVTVSEAEENSDSKENFDPMGSSDPEGSSGLEASDTQPEGSSESPGLSDPSKEDASGEMESTEAISTSVESGKNEEDGSLLNQSAGNNGVLVVMLILILGMGAFGIAFFVNKSRSEYLEE